MKAPARFLLRDVLFTLGISALWLIESLWAPDPGVLQVAFGISLGLLTLVLGALIHEWGHLAGALLTGSVVEYPPGWIGKLLFDFDVTRNDRRQFLAMSLGGYLAAIAILMLYALCLPFDHLAGQVSLVGMMLGTIAILAIEGPITVRVLTGASPPAAMVKASFESRT